jgi:hypothetical protein
LQTKIQALRMFQAQKEDRFPLLHFQAVDDIHQVRGAVLTYYMPLLSLLDYQQLVQSMEEYKSASETSAELQAKVLNEK